MPYLPKFGFTVSMVGSLNTIERMIGFLEAAPLSEEWVQDMQHRALVKEAYATIHLDGAKLSWNEAERSLAGNVIEGVNSAEVRALLNYKDALGFVLEFVKRDEPITENTIREIHKLLIKELKIVGEKPGHYRQNQNYVFDKETKEIIYTPPPPYDLSLLMRDFTSWLEEVKFLPAILISGVAMFHMDTIHPFSSANGRTARLIAMLILYKAGYSARSLYSISCSFDKDQQALINVIHGVRQKGKDLTRWLEYYTDCLAKELHEVLYEAKLKL